MKICYILLLFLILRLFFSISYNDLYILKYHNWKLPFAVFKNLAWFLNHGCNGDSKVRKFRVKVFIGLIFKIKKWLKKRSLIVFIFRIWLWLRMQLFYLIFMQTIVVILELRVKWSTNNQQKGEGQCWKEVGSGQPSKRLDEIVRLYVVKVV